MKLSCKPKSLADYELFELNDCLVETRLLIPLGSYSEALFQC